jgi:hypothetical protein
MRGDRDGSEGGTGAPTSSPISVSIVDRNINGRNEKGHFSRDSPQRALEQCCASVVAMRRPTFRWSSPARGPDGVQEKLS